MLPVLQGQEYDTATEGLYCHSAGNSCLLVYFLAPYRAGQQQPMALMALMGSGVKKCPNIREDK
jgi:hypothetical protein